MTTTLADRRVGRASSDRSPAARRAVTRWAWRLFKREWRRQALILGLLAFAMAAITVGLGTASNAASLKADPTFGTANTILTVSGSDSKLSADLAAIKREFGAIDVIAHRSIPIPGSIASIDLRAESPTAAFAGPTLRLDAGRYATGPGEVAVTKSVATAFGLSIGSTWQAAGHSYRVVGIVENPLDLLDEFAVVAPGQANPATSVSVLLNADNQQLSFRLPSGQGLDIGSRSAAGQAAGAALVLVLGTLGLLFVGLVAMAGFTVLAQRRLRALGMLGALGASDRDIRRVMLANGAAVGGTAAVVGAALGLGAWFALTPALQSLTNQRIDRFDLPWWAIVVAMALAVVTAVGAAWWPARAAARVSVVAALSGRTPQPQPAHRFAAAGATLLGLGVVLLAFADNHRTAFIIGGTLATPIGLVLLAPIALTAVGAAGARTPVSVRLAVRDLARFRARSGAALSAITLAIGIAATIAIAAAASRPPSTAGNLPPNQLVVYLTDSGPAAGQVAALSSAQLAAATDQVDRFASAIGAGRPLALEQAYDPNGPLSAPPIAQGSGPGRQSVGPGSGAGQGGGYAAANLAVVTPNGQGISASQMTPLYVATPEVLAHYGLSPTLVGSAADVLTGRSDLLNRQLFEPDVRPSSSRVPGLAHPTITVVHGLPAYTSAPGALITRHAMSVLGLRPIPAGWLVQTAHPLTASQIRTAQRAAAVGGLYIETRNSKHSLSALQTWSTLAGLLLALGVLAMTVGLIRSETGRDLRTLAANGASGTARRTITAATAATLALLGAILGTAGAYAALLAWYRSNLTPLGHVPVLDLVLLLVGLPVLAGVVAWLVAGREPPDLGRAALE